MRRHLVVMLTVAIAVAGTCGSPAGAASSGVSGPVLPAVAAQSHWVGLESYGFTEDEWFLDGVATAYAPVGTWTADGVWPAQPTTHADFRTRLLVRRPVDPAAFNGTVVVEWDNVSAGFDTGPTWTAAIDELLRRGYAYVGVSAQKVGVEQMKASNVARYGTLNHPGDAYSYDIFTQAARALRGQPGALLLPGLPVQKLVAVGESQSAARMVTYINAVQPLAHAYNGYLVYSRLAGAASIADGVAMPANPRIRADSARIIDVQTEGDLVVLRSHLARQDDSGRFRLWEVAGGSHADEHTLNPKNPPVASVAGSPCEFRMNSARTHFVVGAAVHALDRWTRGLGAPGRAPTPAAHG